MPNYIPPPHYHYQKATVSISHIYRVEKSVQPSWPSLPDMGAKG